MIRWLRGLLLRIVGREVSTLAARCDRAMADARAARIVLEHATRAYDADRMRFDQSMAVVRVEVENALRTQATLEEALLAARSALRVAEDTTIPALVEANKLGQERWRAEVAIQVRRQGLISVDEVRGVD